MKFNLKAGIIFLIVAVGSLFTIRGIALNQKTFPVTHHEAVPQTVSEDGRYVAGSPEIYKVTISKALAWKKATGFSHFSRAVAIFLLVVCAIYLTLYASGIVLFNPKLFAAGCAASFLLYLGAYLSIKENNWIEFSPAQYEVVSSDPGLMEQAFIEKGTIK